jgi:putative ABC transport system permease protein
MEQVLQDVRYALRMLRKNAGFTAISLVALALGIGANTAIFTVVDSVLLRPLSYKEPDRLVQIFRGYKGGGRSESISPTKFVYWREHNHTFTDIAANDIVGTGCNLTGSGQPERVPCIRISSGYFQTLGVPLALGREFLAAEDRPNGERVAIIGYGLWMRRFGSDPNIVGKVINVAAEPYTVVGVGPRGFRTQLESDLWTPLRAQFVSTDRANYLVVTARMKPGATVESAKADMAGVFGQFLRQYPNLKDSDNELVGIAPLHEMVVGDVRQALLILFGAVGFVLLIACANVANLLLARAAARNKEMAIRSAMGAGRMRIVRQMLTESVLLSCGGAVLGVLLARWAIYALVALSPGNLPRAGEIGMDWMVLAFAAGLAVITGLLFGLAPALQMSRSDTNESLKEGGRGTSGGVKSQRMRNLLVVSEVALALILVVGAALLIESFRRLHNVEPGFDAANVLTFKTTVNPKRYKTPGPVDTFYKQVIQRIESIPGVSSAATVTNVPMEPGPDLPFNIEGRETKGAEPTGGAQYRNVTPNYFKTMSISLKQGRYFTENDVENSEPVIVINEEFVKRWFKKENPIGQRITIGRIMGPPFTDKTREIVGVVGSVREYGPGRDAPEAMFIPASQCPDALSKLITSLIPVAWVVKTSSVSAAQTARITAELLRVDADQPLSDLRTMDEITQKSMSRERFNTALLGTMAGLALLLASIGIYGVISYGVTQRAHEMGIRLALGAGRTDLLRLIVGNGMLVAGTGVVIGLAAAYWLSRLMASLLYGVKPNDPLTFGTVAMLLIAVAAVASYIPARRAAKVDPVIALRYQ